MNRPCCNLKMTCKLFVFIWALAKETACYAQMGLTFLDVKWALFKEKGLVFCMAYVGFSLSFLFSFFKYGSPDHEPVGFQQKRNNELVSIEMALLTS